MARIIPFDDSAHADAQALLPWYVTDRLDRSERAKVAAHLARCPQCREEADFQVRLGGQISQLPLEVDQGWRKMERLIGRTDARATPRAWLELARVWMMDAWRSRMPEVVGWSVAFALVVTAAGLLVTARSSQSDYHTLSAAAVPSAANAMVVFRPETSEGELNADLLSAHARIVDGPTVAGAYLLAVPQAERKTALEGLRRRAVVVAAEPIDMGNKGR